MTVLKCKMCGGSLAVTADETIFVCEYCKTKQTLPKSRDEEITNLFNRANHLRLRCEFDKAEKVYEKIVNIDDTEAEAHWGMVLCRYGVEYVEDPKTYTRIPTCHRTLYEAVGSDTDYLMAIEHSDFARRELYQQEAASIDALQKKILNIVNSEKPFDVFICYKETDAVGNRTPDSVLANDIYYQLTQQGYKVFYSAITLEDKLGSEYEPYIYAALTSARVMLVVGTKPEYFDAVWVRNEWGRFLKQIDRDRTKTLIPCYRDMDPYDLPEEFAHLQAQDMAKIGFINDLIRGIRKIVSDSTTAKTQSEAKKATADTVHNPNLAPLIKRMFMFLEDGDWKSADEYGEKVLDQDPECADAYLGKLMAAMRLGDRTKMAEFDEPFDSLPLYKKIQRFGSPELVAELDGYNQTIRERAEAALREEQYQKAKKAMETAWDAKTYQAASKAFLPILDYLDSFDRHVQCLELAKQKDYQIAMEHIKRDTVSGYDAAIPILKALGDYQDCAEWLAVCEKKRAELKIAEEKRQAEANEAARKAEARKKKISLVCTLSACAAVLLIILYFTVIEPNVRKNTYYKNGEYGKLVKEFGMTDFVIPDGVTSIGDYAFYSCDALTSITIPEGVTSIGDYAFCECAELISITIPDSVTSIGDYAFDGCDTLTSITIPDGVTSIGNRAFHSCGALTSITIPSSVTSIGDYAFSGCDALTSITISDGVTSIGKGAFYSCDALTSITIPDGVTSIGKGAFYECGALTSITIPDGVTSIGDYAFCYCVNLDTVYYDGIKSQWGQIAIGSVNSAFTSATVYFYSETAPATWGNYWHYVNGVPTKW